jgi:hypothetical protein
MSRNELQCFCVEAVRHFFAVPFATTHNITLQSLQLLYLYLLSLRDQPLRSYCVLLHSTLPLPGTLVLSLVLILLVAFNDSLVDLPLEGQLLLTEIS